MDGLLELLYEEAPQVSNIEGEIFFRHIDHEFLLAVLFDLKSIGAFFLSSFCVSTVF